MSVEAVFTEESGSAIDLAMAEAAVACTGTRIEDEIVATIDIISTTAEVSRVNWAAMEGMVMVAG